MQITKAVITAGSPAQRALPLQAIVDSDGTSKPVLAILLEDITRAGIEEVAVIVPPGDEPVFHAALGPAPCKVVFIPQEGPSGYAQALLCAREFAGGKPFLHLVGDHLFVRSKGASCARHLLEAAAEEDCSISLVQPTRENLLPRFGTVGGQPVRNRPYLYTVDKVVEKPTPTEAEQTLLVPGLRAGHYLCFFGMHVLTPTIFTYLAEVTAGANRPLSLSAALNRLAREEKYLALEVPGCRRFDLGARYGVFNAQLAMALEGPDRDEVLAGLLDLVANRFASAETAAE
jgi:UTP--glucose-1-phosphate uridylyltransferase